MLCNTTQKTQKQRPGPWNLRHSTIGSLKTAVWQNLFPLLAASIHIEGMQQSTRHIFITLCRHSMKKNKKWMTLSNTSKEDAFHGFLAPWNFQSPDSPSIEKYTAFPGIILQYIDGFTLSNLAVYAPKSHWQYWQSVCDQAINIIHQITHKRILNADVRARNFNFQQEQRGRFKRFMNNFGSCYFPRDCDDDDHWWAWKSAQDEEGTLAYDMKKLLKEGYVYQRSALCTELDHRF